MYPWMKRKDSMRKLEQIKTQYMKTQAKKERLQNDIVRLKETRATFNQAARKCAEADDIDGYRINNRQAAELSDEIAVKEIMLSACVPVPLEAAKDAWNEYAANAETELEKRKAALEKKIQEFYAAFVDLVDYDLEILEAREDVFLYATGNRPPDSLVIHASTLFKDFPVKVLTLADVGKACQFFLQVGLLSEEYDKVIGRASQFRRAPVKNRE